MGIPHLQKYTNSVESVLHGKLETQAQEVDWMLWNQ